jgi:hypothetical protein
MGKTPGAAGTEPGGRGATGHLAVVVATTLPNAHTPGQILAGLTAPTLALAHDVLIRKQQKRV